MDLETAQSLWFTRVTEAQVREAFRDDFGRGEYIILSREPEVYIQAWGEFDGPYALEYRDGHRSRHFRVQGQSSKSDAELAFLWYLAGDPRWLSEFPWQPFDVGSWWRLW